MEIVRIRQLGTFFLGNSASSRPLKLMGHVWDGEHFDLVLRCDPGSPDKTLKLLEHMFRIAKIVT